MRLITFGASSRVGFEISCRMFTVRRPQRCIFHMTRANALIDSVIYRFDSWGRRSRRSMTERLFGFRHFGRTWSTTGWKATRKNLVIVFLSFRKRRKRGADGSPNIWKRWRMLKLGGMYWQRVFSDFGGQRRTSSLGVCAIDG